MPNIAKDISKNSLEYSSSAIWHIKVALFWNISLAIFGI
jgi:hypothetical protein